MPIHDWTGGLDSSFHAVHAQWGGRLVAALNGGLLPPGYSAMPEQIATRMQTDVPRQLKRRPKSVVVRHKSDHRIVGVIEIVSPATKDRRDSVRDLASKVVQFIESNISALLIDLWPATKHDPHGIHGAIWAHYDTEPYLLPEDGPLTLASYIGRPGDPEAFVEPVTVGQVLPDMPLFLWEEKGDSPRSFPGGGTMNGFVVELPAELHAEVARRAGQEPGDEAAWVADAVREKLAACAQLEYLEGRAARGTRAAYDRVLAKVPAAAPVPGDERPSAGRPRNVSE